MRHILLCICLIFLAAPTFAAEAYPSKPVTIVVPYGPGNTADIVGRIIAQRLSEQLGKPFAVDNRPGASGIIGNGIVAQSEPDGYKLSLADFSLVTAPSLYKSVPWDPIKDFTPITQVARGSQVLAVSPNVQARTLKEFIALAKANPGKFNYGSGGTGSGTFLATELFKTITQVNLVHVPYKGMADAATGLLSNQVQVLIASVPVLSSFIKANQVRVLAVTSDGKRLPTMPDIPSMQEEGVPGMVYYSWFGLIARSGTAQPIINMLHDEVIKALADRAIVEKLVALGVEPVGDTPAQFSELINNERTRWGGIIRTTGVVLQQ